MTTRATSGELERFDFSRHGQVLSENARQWQIWLDGTLNELKEAWTASSRSPISLSAGDQAILRFDALRQRFPNPAVACEMATGANAMNSMLVLDRPLALSLVLQLLGDDSGKIPEDRALSEIEITVCESFLRMFAASIREAWPRKERLDCQIRGMELTPHRSRLWEPRRSIFASTILIGEGAQSRPIYWASPVDELENLLRTLDEKPVEPSREIKKRLEERILDVPVPVTVEIGRTAIPVTRLSALQPGDVIVFPRRINDPMPLLVDNKPKFFGWLGRVGGRQVFKVSEVLTQKTGSPHHDQ
jgi:flagellar motor switch protein FliM